jgi:transposase
VHAFRVFGGVPARGVYDSEAWPPWVRRQAERARRLIVSAKARSGRAMPGF